MDEQFETAGNTDSDLIFDDHVSTHSGDHGIHQRKKTLCQGAHLIHYTQIVLK